MDLFLPFKVGDLAESKSSLKGFRGAWFRCKIHGMRVREPAGYLEYHLEYIDYTEEKKEWLRVFQKNPTGTNQNSSQSTQLMLRPSFPQWYYGHEVPEQFPNRDVTAIVDETWKVGDLVDWLNEGCYWSGTITKLLNEDMIEIELLAPPIGEGERYQAHRNDLRPTLEWSLTKKWIVPLSQANGKSWYAARLLGHVQSESEKSSSYEESSSDDEYGDNKGSVLQPVSRASNMSQESPGPVILAPPKDEKDNILPYVENLKPSSTSKSADLNHGTKFAAASSQPAGTRVSIKQESGIGGSSKQEQDWSLTKAEADDDIPDEFLEKLDALQADINYLMERTHVEHDRCSKALAFCRGSSKDDASGK